MNILFFLLPKKDVAFIFDDSSMRQALEKIYSSGFTQLPVLDKEGHYKYSLSEGDILYEIKKNNSYSDDSACNIFINDIVKRRDIKAIKVDTPMEDLYQLALRQNFIPVVDDREIFIGIVTRQAVINYLINPEKYQEV